MGMVRRFDQVLYKREKTKGEKFFLAPLLLFSLPYGWAVRIRSLLYELHLIQSKKLPKPVLSVGNITMGGTGKTPLVMALARGLKERGIRVAILSRGYRRKKRRASLVTDGREILLPPDEAGDEPFLMAHTLKGIPVLVGKDRFQTGTLALEQFSVKGLLLDDGFQHLRLARDLDIVLVDSQVGFGDGHLFPRGILREPLFHLKRASLFVLTKAEDLEACRRLQRQLHQIHPGAPVFYSRFVPTGLVEPDGTMAPLALLKGRKVLALSGIARPEDFSSLIRRLGGEVVKERIFPDHHRYRLRDLTSLREEVKKLELIITTEKDWVKLKSFPIEPLPLYALRIETKIEEEDEFFKRVMEVFDRGGIEKGFSADGEEPSKGVRRARDDAMGEDL
ncbi:MAG: tetraacyldisaccharide 4'-kinase [Desulfobacterota bacterium]|nr:tetraacyldisaccharide 4'-kinase [Thermodesulfobacteriota bacterium]